ncbi:Uncharacterized protein YbbC [Chlamydiales bacterium SCGC AG-110-P3]|nr:Uncharacterized protein YbbC [Chlamydiales bacterium SCGC AG-110-P3]
MRKLLSLLLFAMVFLCGSALSAASVKVGLERVFEPSFKKHLKDKRVGLITNHTAVTRQLKSSIDLFKENQFEGYKLSALFGPEHGIYGLGYAEEKISGEKDDDGIPVYSLHGSTRRPTEQMLKDIDILVFDIQDIGARAYTYITTLFYCMEEAAKRDIPVMVLDRPNPLNGLIIDGPMLDDNCRSYVSYINVPYCHGMTIGELARYFNAEYKVGCELVIVPMEGWHRSMSFHDSGLPWIPTSPQIPEADTAYYYPTTGILGELQIVNIGVGYTLPFKCVGAPWIDADAFAEALNEQKFPGVAFRPFYYRPYFGRFARQNCEGVLIVVSDPVKFKPVSTQYLILGILKSMYPKQVADGIASSKKRKRMFCKVNGTEEVYDILTKEKFIVWKLRELHQDRRDQFTENRRKYLLYR